MHRPPLRSALVAGGLVVALSAPLTGAAAAAATPTPDPSASASAAPDPGPPPAPAGPFATSLSLTRSAGTVTFGAVLTLTGVLTRMDGSGIGDAPVQVVSRTGGQSGTVVVATVRTGSDGRLVSRLSPRTTAEYQLRYGGGSLDAPSSSNKTVASIRPRISGAFATSGLKARQTTVLRGSVAPAYAGARVAIRRRAGDGTWHDNAVVGISSSGGYSWAFTPTAAGRYVFQVVLPARPAYLQAATPAMGVDVDSRDLHRGDSGSDVLSLERRLAAQRADVGRVDGVFDYDLEHAVLAFQKSQGIARTSVYDSATRLRLGAPVAVRLRYPSPGRAIEIDLRKQVLYLSEGGVLRRILDVSTGSGRLYDQDGVTHRATTPLGRFSILRKINDPNHRSPLGILYRPAFFYQGWAIHGSSSVPAFPASHGCVRITDPAMDRLYDLLTIGTPVAVYAG